jgi:hypothetical protein
VIDPHKPDNVDPNNPDNRVLTIDLGNGEFISRDATTGFWVYIMRDKDVRVCTTIDEAFRYALGVDYFDIEDIKLIQEIRPIRRLDGGDIGLAYHIVKVCLKGGTCKEFKATEKVYFDPTRAPL